MITDRIGLHSVLLPLFTPAQPGKKLEKIFLAFAGTLNLMNFRKNISPVQTRRCASALPIWIKFDQALPCYMWFKRRSLGLHCCVALNKIIGEIAFPRGVKRRIVTRDQSILNLVRLWYNVWIREPDVFAAVFRLVTQRSPHKVCGEERCATGLKTAEKETRAGPNTQPDSVTQVHRYIIIIYHATPS